MSVLKWFIDDMREEGHRVPVKWEVCYHCRGEGKSSAHLGAFFPGDEWLADPDFREDYAAGNYDRTCDECNGRTTVQVFDEDSAPDWMVKEYEGHVIADADLRSMEAAERRMGC